MTQSRNDSHTTGNDYEMSVPFGRARVSTLLRALATILPVGSSIEFITPIGKDVKQFLEQFGEARKSGFLKPKIWSLDHSSPEGSLFQLARLAEERAITELAVWFTVVGPDGATLLEAEDGNTVLFISDAIPPDSITAILGAVGVSGPGVASTALRRSVARGLTNA